MKKILNILLGVFVAITVVLLGYAIVMAATDGAESAVFKGAVSLNIIWCYLLLAMAILAALFCAVFGMIENPAGLKGSLLSVGLIIVVVGVSYFIANGHSIQIPDIANGGLFTAGTTVIAETSILVSYVALVGAFLTAVCMEIYGAFK